MTAGPGWYAKFEARPPLTRAALTYARRAHGTQRRADGSPFILHPIEVATLLHDAGAADHVVAAGALHDVLEKTEATVLELQARFGARVTRLVLAVTDDPAISGYGRRKAALRRQVASAGEDALTLFAADKVSKLRELSREAPSAGAPGDASVPPRELRARRLRHYQRSLALLEERLPEHELVATLRTELHAYLSERARVGGRS